MSAIEMMQGLWPSPNWTQETVDLWHERLSRAPLSGLGLEQVRAVLGQAKIDGLNPHSARGQKRESDANQILARLHDLARREAPARETVNEETGEVIPPLSLAEAEARLEEARASGQPGWIIRERERLVEWIRTGKRPPKLVGEGDVGYVVKGAARAVQYEGE